MATFISYAQHKQEVERKMKKQAIVIAGLGLLVLSNVQADHRRGNHDYGYDNPIEHRQERQYRRIEKGIRSGVLTRREIEKLRCEQDDIARLERRFLRDGWFSDREQRKLQRKLNKASNRIYKYKHNGRNNRKYHRDHYSHNDYRSPRYQGSRIHIGGRNGSFKIRW